MSLTREQEKTLTRRLKAWSAALARDIQKHGADNSFGVRELAGEYALEVKDGYAIPQNGRLPLLEQWLREKHKIDVALDYRRGRYITTPRTTTTSFTPTRQGRELVAEVRRTNLVQALRALVVKLGLPENSAAREALRPEYEAGLAALMGPEYAAATSARFTEGMEIGRKIFARGHALTGDKQP